MNPIGHVFGLKNVQKPNPTFGQNVQVCRKHDGSLEVFDTIPNGNLHSVVRVASLKANEGLTYSGLQVETAQLPLTLNYNVCLGHIKAYWANALYSNQTLNRHAANDRNILK